MGVHSLAAHLLRDQLERIEEGGYRWVDHCPNKQGQACVAYRFDFDTVYGLADDDIWTEEQGRVVEMAHRALYAAIEATGAYSIIDWNDNFCENADQAKAVLAMAIDWLS